MEKVNQENLLKSLIDLVNDKEFMISFWLKRCFITEKNENEIVLVCEYEFHAEILNKLENKEVIEKGFLKLLEKNVIVKIISLKKAIEKGYKIAIEKQKEIDSVLEERQKIMEIGKVISDNERIKARIIKRIPLRFKDAELQNSGEAVQDYFNKKKYKEKGLFLFGKVGVGKTYDIYALTKSLLKENMDVQVFNLPRLLNVIRASFSKQEVYNEDADDYSYAFVKDMSDIEKLINVEVLMIDDIGAEKPSDWVAETLYHLINSRYEKMKTTIFTSNLNLDELAERINHRIITRIADMCDICEKDGENKRIKEKK